MTTPTTTHTAARTIDLPLGTTPGGAPVSWLMSDPTGRPVHGLVVGPCGSGGSTALVRLAASARAAGIHPIVVLLGRGTGYHDSAWARAPWGTSFCTDADELARDLDQVLAQLGPSPAPRLVLVDGSPSLHAIPGQWSALLRQADRLQVSVAARVYRPGREDLGGEEVRSRLTADGQYLALGRSLGFPTLMRDHLPGYTPPAHRQKPGRGVYGRAGHTRPVTVTTA